MQANENFNFIESLKILLLTQTFRKELTSGDFVPAIKQLEITFDITSDILGESTATISVPFRCGKDDEQKGGDGSFDGKGSENAFSGVEIAKEKKKD